MVPEVPATLQQIETGDLERVKELGRGQFGSVWLQVRPANVHVTYDSDWAWCASRSDSQGCQRPQRGV